MNRTCAQMQMLAPLAAEGSLDEGERSRLRKHAAGCRECSQAVAFHARLREALESAPLNPPPPLYFEGALAAVHRRLPARLRSLRVARALVRLRSIPARELPGFSDSGALPPYSHKRSVRSADQPPPETLPGA